ncbi:MAG: cupin domain-containing protein [SAR202 cluster bacterium]|jgi:mannose-6-phosphate isomerase-like protein (cupin superfamily)|nr:cupin domain-containing protein [SAR202 cluster bacterium]|tara:strand:- start:432 stop:716 length:285 start_codon:yes stop_codon:yes gene_type:complete
MTNTPAETTRFIDNDRVRVTEWRFAPGTETGRHVHEMDYVVVPLITGTLAVVDDDGERDNNITHGVPYLRKAGVEHNVVNRGGEEVAFMEIELK